MIYAVLKGEAISLSPVLNAYLSTNCSKHEDVILIIGEVIPVRDAARMIVSQRQVREATTRLLLKEIVTDRVEAAAVDGTRAKLFESAKVSRGAIALMISEAVAWIHLIHLTQVSIAGCFCKN